MATAKRRTRRKAKRPEGMSSQASNGNALRHALTASYYHQSFRLELGKLPKGLYRIEQHVNDYRQALERAVFDCYGRIGWGHAHRINSACRWERFSRLVHRRLKIDGVKLNADQWLKYEQSICQASDRRDAAVLALGIDQDDVDSLPAFPDAIDVSEDPAPTPDATDGQPASQEGNADDRS